MSLYSNGNCAYCGAQRPKARHLIYCKSTNRLWVVLVQLVNGFVTLLLIACECEDGTHKGMINSKVNAADLS